MNHSFDQAYATVKQLVQDFQDGSARYMRADYKEQAVRVDFIDPFFEALGWDVNHKHQRDPFKREVEAERSEKEGRVDYSFHLAPEYRTPVFFVEAKKPFVEIKNELHYKQTIGYAWNAGLPVSIITDFQQFHILDCRNKVKAGDGSWLVGDHKEYVFTDFLNKEKFAEIYYLFSHEGVEAGNIQKYVDKLRKPKGKAVQTGLFKGGYRTVDEDFLAYIDELREELAKALKKNNEELGSEELTEATQRIVDRLVFIRFLEDKGILDNYYVSEFGAKGNSWQDFVNTCLTLNTEYNGVVFKKHFIDDKHFAGPDDKMFRESCRDICHLNSPYNFNYIPIHILGSIYEQFLGKVIHATAKQAKVQYKEEVRKAGGVYYTPKYIVEYIVENTIGKLIKDKTPKEIAKLRFADIACGSGSFLISVYEHLLDYHTVYYNKPENIVQAQKDGCRRDEEGVWQLSIEQKQDILRNNIYGVDIDAQAVEVSQLSLYLKMLEKENVVTVAKHLAKKGRLFGADKILPDLSNNIKCGNSLIGSDIQTGQLFADDELKKLNPFDYEAAFPEIFKTKTVKKVQHDRYDMDVHTKQNIVEEPMMIFSAKEIGGFDAIVGNPPYGADFTEVGRNYLKTNFESFSLRGESYVLFIENATKRLKQNGLLGYIIPDTYLNLDFTKGVRDFLLKNTTIWEILSLHSRVFKDAIVDTTLLFCQRVEAVSDYKPASVEVKLFDKKATKIDIDSPHREFSVDTEVWFKLKSFNIQSDTGEISLIRKLDTQFDRIESIADMYSGIKVYEVGKGNPTQTPKIRDTKPYTSNTQVNDKWSPFFDGKHISRYETLWKSNNWVNYGAWIAAPRAKENFLGEKLLIRKIIGKTLLASYVSNDVYCNTLLFILKLKENCNLDYKYVLGILNSSFIGWYFRKKFQIADDDTFPQIMIRDILQFALPTNPPTAQHAQIVLLVNQMLEGKKKLSEAKTDKDKEFYTRKCEALDKQIDNAVFEIYGLTEEEKEIVLNS